MSCEPQYTRIQLRRDIASDWQLNNPVLSEGEAGYELDTGKLKIGNGTTAWNLLPYFDDRTANWTDIQGRPINVSDLINDVGYLTLADLPPGYVLPTATDVRLGGIKVGANLTVAVDGTLNAEAGDYTLPTASTSVLGGVKVDGTTVTIVDGVISATDPNLLGNLVVTDQTIAGTNINGDISIAPDGFGTVNVPSLTLPVGSVIQSISAVDVVIADLILDTVVDYSTGPGDTLLPGTVGNLTGIAHPWAVYRFTTTPTPALQVGDVIGGASVPIGSTIVYAGTSSYDKYIVTDRVFPLGVPANGATITTVRPTVNANISISTAFDTDIALTPGGGLGVVVTHSDIVPIRDNEFTLGTPTKRFQQVWIGPGTIYIADDVLGVDISLAASNSNLVVQGGKGLKVGEFTLSDNQILLENPARDIIIGTSGATADVVFNRSIRINDSIGKEVFKTDRTGRTQFYPPNIPGFDIGGVSIIGSPDAGYQPVQFEGGLLHLTSNQDKPARVTVDGFGAGAYAQITGRAGRGTASIPSALQVNDSMMRITAVGWGTTQSPTTPAPTAIEFVATENYTDSAYGSKINIYTAPNGTATKQLSAAIDHTGLLFTGNTEATAGITFKDTTRQTTAWLGSLSYNSLTDKPDLSVYQLSANAFSGAYDDLTGKPNVVTSVAVTSGLTVGRVNGAVTLGNSGVLSVAAAAGTGQLGVSTVSGAVTLTMPQGLGTTSNVTFNDLTINGTLTVENFELSTAPTIAGKILYLAADATVATDIDGGGFWLGPIADAYSRSFLYNLEFDRWDTDGAGLKTLQLDADSINVMGTGFFGNAYNDYNFPNAAIQIDGSVDGYLQTVNKNHSDGIIASSDFVATNDIGTDIANYIDMGIVSSNYTDALWPILAANDGYVYINGGNLRIGTDTATKDIKFFTGGTLATNVRATISDAGLTVVGTTSSTGFSGPLTGNVTGNVTGNAGTVTNGVYTTDTGTVTNLMLAGSIANNKLTNSSITVNGTTISLGGSGTIAAAAGTLTGSVLASNVTSSSLTSVGTLTNLTVTNPISGSVTGNAGSVTNGVYTTGSYTNPSWIVSLDYSKIANHPAIPAAQIQSDWNQTNNTFLDYIKNKPTIPTVPTLISAFTNDSGYITSAALTGYATQVYVNSQGFITASALTGYATQTYVNSQGFITTGSLSVTSNTPSGATSTLTYTGGVFTFTSAAANSYVLPTASTTVLGGVKVDGTTIVINGSGVISATNTNVGTVTSVAALTIGSAGIDITSTVANSTTTPVITLNVPTASATTRGALSSSDWTLFNGKGTVSSVTGTGSVSGLSLSGTVTSTGNITLGGSLTLTSLQITTGLGYTPGTGNGTVTSVATAGSVNGITLTGGTITSAGTITLGGTLSGIANNQLTNSTISGVALGGSLFNLTAGTGITFSSGTTYNGSAAITINASASGVSSLAGGTNIVLSESTGAVTIQRVDGLQTVVTANSGATYNVTTTDQYIGTTRSLTGTGTITLPLGSTVSVGRQYIIKDEGGQSGNVFRRITVAASGSDTIDGSATRSITSNFGSLTVLWTGTRWSVI